MTLMEAIARAMANADKWHANSPESHRPVAFVHEEYRDLARAALTAIEASGHVVVPKEPTPEMIGAWYRYKNGFHYHDEPAPLDTSDYGAYAAMLSARPEVN